MTVRELPKFKGYVVDERLREFRKLAYGYTPEFIPFDSERGEMMLEEMRKTKPIDKSDMFEETCNAMGGEYEEEYSMLEPDVGGEFLTEHETKKQWCTFRDMHGVGKFIARGIGGGELTVFNAPNTFEVKFQDENRKELFRFWDNDIEKKFDSEEQKMCFYSRYGIRVPKCDICIQTYPLREHGRPSGVWLKLEPRSGD